MRKIDDPNPPEILTDADFEEEGLPVVPIPDYIPAIQPDGENVLVALSLITEVIKPKLLPHTVKYYIKIRHSAELFRVNYSDYAWLCEHWFKIPE